MKLRRFRYKIRFYVYSKNIKASGLMKISIKFEPPKPDQTVDSVAIFKKPVNFCMKQMNTLETNFGIFRGEIGNCDFMSSRR